MLAKDIDKTQKLFLTFILFSIVLSFFTIGTEKIFFSDNAEKIAIKNGINKAIEREKSFKDFLYSSERSIKYLRELNIFKEYLVENKKTENLTQLFYSYTKINPQFKQLKFIDKLGIENISVKRGAEYFDPYIVEENELKNLSKKYYFLESKKLKSENAWFSPITIEKENHEYYVQNEDKPVYERTLKTILPIVIDNQFQGLLVIDYFMDSFLDKLANTPLYDMSLVNDKGQFVIHYDSDDENKKHSLKDEFPKHYKDIIDTPILQTDKFVSKKLNLPIRDGLYIILQLKKEYINEVKSSNINRHLTFSVSILFGALLLSLFIIKFFSNTILDYEEVISLNQKLNSASKIAKIGFWEYNVLENRVYWNGGVFNIYEIDNYEGVMDKEFTFSFFLDEDRQEIENMYEKSILEDTPLFISKKIKTQKGNLKDIEIRARHYFDKKGRYIKSIGSVLDTTEQHKKQEEIDNTKKRFELALMSTKDGVWDWDVQNDKVYFSDNWKDMLGYESDEISDNIEEWSKRVHPDDMQEVTKDLNTHLENKTEFYENVHRMQHKNGNWIWVLDRGKAQFDENNKATRMIGFHTDITKQKQNEEKIKEILSQVNKEKIKFEKLLESAPDAIIIMNNEGKVVDYNTATKKLLGYNDVEMVNLRVTDWDEGYSLDEIDELFEKTKENETLSFEALVKRKDGTLFNASISSTKIKIAKREFFFSAVRDISVQKELEKNIQEQKEKFETIYNYSKDGIAIVDLESNFLEFNQAYLEMTEFTKEELLTKSCNELTVQEEKDAIKHTLEQALEKGYLTNFEKTCLTKSGKRIKINMSASLLPDKQTFLIVAKDMTILKLLDEQSKLAAMGEMIGNIAHQWRQPLSIISTSASSIKFKIEFDDEPDKEFVIYSSDMIVDQVNYLSKTIDDFRNFIKGDASIVDISILDVLNSTFTLVEATINNNYIQLVKDLEDDLTILGNKNELQQAIINIINNAKDAIKENVEEDENKLLFISTKKIDEETLELKITDSGGGIKEEAIDRLFEPYFTTKDEETGTGIGLAMVDKIIQERHHAKINVSNETFTYNDKEYKGACFSILFTSSQDIELF